MTIKVIERVGILDNCTSNDISDMRLFNDIVVSADNLIYAGYEYKDRSGNTTARILRVNQSTGNRQNWCYNSTENEDSSFLSVAVDTDGNYIAVGYVSSRDGYYDALAIKFNKYLEVVTVKLYSGGNYNCFNSVMIESGGDIICTGSSCFINSETYNKVRIRFDKDLNILSRSHI